MKTTKQERIAAFSVALEEVYQNIQNGKKTNFSELTRNYNLGNYGHCLKKALHRRHLTNEECTHWNPEMTTPNVGLAGEMYKECALLYKEIQDAYKERKKDKVDQIPVCEEETPIQEPKYSLDETVELVKHYGIFKVLWKCLFG